MFFYAGKYDKNSQRNLKITKTTGIASIPTKALIFYFARNVRARYVKEE